MTSENPLRDLLRQIDADLAAAGVADDWSWATRANVSSLSQLQREVTGALLGHQARLRARFHKGTVIGNAGPAHAILRVASELNEAVVSAANRLLSRPYLNITDDLRGRLGLWLLPVSPGSVVLEMACPAADDDRRRQHRLEDDQEPTIPGTEDVASVTTAGLAHVMEALESVTRADVEAVEVELALRKLGTHGIRHLARLASRTEAGDFNIDFSTVHEARTLNAFTFAPRDAAFLKSIIRNRDLDVQLRRVVGWLSTASSVRNVFDVVTDAGERISGTVATGVREQVVVLFNTRVRAAIEERIDPSDPSGDRVSQQLVSVEAADD